MKEQIEKRIEELKKSRDQYLAHFNACSGAIIELQLFLSKLESPSDKTDEKK